MAMAALPRLKAVENLLTDMEVARSHFITLTGPAMDTDIISMPTMMNTQLFILN